MSHRILIVQSFVIVEGIFFKSTFLMPFFFDKIILFNNSIILDAKKQFEVVSLPYDKVLENYSFGQKKNNSQKFDFVLVFQLWRFA